jgi:hypothetical protein
MDSYLILRQIFWKLQKSDLFEMYENRTNLLNSFFGHLAKNMN